MVSNYYLDKWLVRLDRIIAIYERSVVVQERDIELRATGILDMEEDDGT